MIFLFLCNYKYTDLYILSFDDFVKSSSNINICLTCKCSGTFPVTVYGSFLPRHIFYRLHALCAYLRCLFVALCVLFMWPSFDIILADQVSVVIPVLKLKKSAQVNAIWYILIYIGHHHSCFIC